MRIEFNLPHVFYPEASQVENALAVEASLNYLVELNLAWLRFHPATPPLYRSGVKYGRTQIWETIPALYARGYGDCKSLSCALVAEYLMQGIQCSPVHRFVINPGKDGNTDYHVLVQIGSKFEDPSKRLGMPVRELNKFYANG